MGVYYNDNILNNEDASSECFYPIYNVGEITFQDFTSITEELYEMTIDTPLGRDKPNFVLDSINLKKFYKQHKETSSFFYSTNKVKLELLLIIIHDLSIQITSKTHNSFGHFYNLLQRGYVLYDKKKFFNSLKKRISRIERLLELPTEKYNDDEVKKAFDFFTFSNSRRKLLDLNYCSLYYPFVDVQDFFLIDLSWIYRTFLTLFFKLQMDDQNFKGTNLEISINTSKSVLPTTTLKAIDETEHQIDYSFIKGDCLFILECKSVAMSVAFEKGDPAAIRKRIDDVVNRSLKEVDIKANWLINHTEILEKYNIKINYIVPLGVSAFVEYIPSKDEYYWLNNEIPRVLTPKEVEMLKNDNIDIFFNKMKV